MTEPLWKPGTSPKPDNYEMLPGNGIVPLDDQGNPTGPAHYPGGTPAPSPIPTPPPGDQGAGGTGDPGTGPTAPEKGTESPEGGKPEDQGPPASKREADLRERLRTTESERDAKVTELTAATETIERLRRAEAARVAGEYLHTGTDLFDLNGARIEDLLHADGTVDASAVEAASKHLISVRGRYLEKRGESAGPYSTPSVPDRRTDDVYRDGGPDGYDPDRGKALKRAPVPSNGYHSLGDMNGNHQGTKAYTGKDAPPA